MANAERPPIPACPRCGRKDWLLDLIGWSDAMGYRITPDGDWAHVYTDFNIYDTITTCGRCKLSDQGDDPDIDPEFWDRLLAALEEAKFLDEVQVGPRDPS